MRASNYNFIYEKKNGSYVIYNSYSNALAILSEEEYRCISDSDFDFSNAIDNTVDLELLKQNGFVIDDDFDETDVIRERMLLARYDDSILGLTIAPTLDCNFRCSYCYEKGCDKNEIMSQETLDAIISFVESRQRGLKKIAVTWYGGEPLLTINIIEYLTSRLKEICEKNDLSYFASIISNGFLLDEAMAKRLKNCDISFCQVTIDGDENEHNLRRPLSTGKETYRTIIDNVFAASNYFPVSVRVNTDYKNLDAAFKVREIFSDRKETVSVYPAPVRNNYECYSKEECLEKTDFLLNELHYFRQLDSDFMMQKYPRAISNACCADSINAYIIAPNGDLYKCWSDIGRKEYCMGNIKTGKTFITNAIRYSRLEPPREEKCSKCKFLPVCMGGCPRDAVEKSDYRCQFDEDVFKEYILDLSSKILAES